MSRAIERVARRFRDVELFRRVIAQRPASAERLDQITVVLRDEPSAAPQPVYLAGSDSPLQATLIDGYHRLFLARLFGVPQTRTGRRFEECMEVIDRAWRDEGRAKESVRKCTALT